jgi:TPR repeat protein
MNSRMHSWGKGVPRDEARALKWLNRAAEQRHSEAQSELKALMRIKEAKLRRCIVELVEEVAGGSED